MRRKILIILTFLSSVVILSLLAQQVGALSFNLSLDPQQGSTGKGGVLKSAVNLYSSSSEKKRVTLFPAVEPKGIKIRFSPTSCTPPCSSIMTISVSEEAENRNYSIPIVATGEGITRTTTYYLTISPFPSVLGTPQLVFPLNNSTVSSLTPFLDWSEATGARVYQWTVGNKTGQTTNSFLVVSSGILKYNTKYDWKVKACSDSSQENCSEWSEQRSFVTPQNQQFLLETLQSQIAALRAAILQLQEQLRKLISSGGIW